MSWPCKVWWPRKWSSSLVVLIYRWGELLLGLQRKIGWEITKTFYFFWQSMKESTLSLAKACCSLAYLIVSCQSLLFLARPPCFLPKFRVPVGGTRPKMFWAARAAGVCVWLGKILDILFCSCSLGRRRDGGRVWAEWRAKVCPCPSVRVAWRRAMLRQTYFLA